MEGHREPQGCHLPSQIQPRTGQPGDIATHDDDSSDHGAGEAAESEMAIAPETDDTPSWSATTQSSDPPPGSGAVGVEGDMANLMVSSPKNPDGGGKDASI